MVIHEDMQPMSDLQQMLPDDLDEWSLKQEIKFHFVEIFEVYIHQHHTATHDTSQERSWVPREFSVIVYKKIKNNDIPFLLSLIICHVYQTSRNNSVYQQIQKSRKDDSDQWYREI